MGDMGSGRKFPRSSCESLGKDEERRVARRPCGSWTLYGEMCNRRDEIFEGGFESKALKKRASCLLVPMKSS